MAGSDTTKTMDLPNTEPAAQLVNKLRIEFGLPASDSRGRHLRYQLHVVHPNGCRVAIQEVHSLSQCHIPPGASLEIRELPLPMEINTAASLEMYQDFQLRLNEVGSSLRFIVVRPEFGEFQHGQVLASPDASSSELAARMVENLRLPERSISGEQIIYHMEIEDPSSGRRRLARFEEPGRLTLPSSAPLWLVGEAEPISVLKDTWRQVFNEELWLGRILQENDSEASENVPFGSPAEITGELNSLINIRGDQYFIEIPRLRTWFSRCLRKVLSDEQHLEAIASDLTSLLRKVLKIQGMKSAKGEGSPQSESKNNKGKKKSLPTVGIVTVLPEEFNAMKRQIIDCRTSPGSPYFIGEVPARDGGSHTVALAFGLKGLGPAAVCATQLHLEFKKTMKVVIMVGIAGGVPWPEKPEEHVRLGDVVFCNEEGVVQYDFGKLTHEGVFRKPPPRPPDPTLLYWSRILMADELNNEFRCDRILKKALDEAVVTRPPETADVLYSSSNSNEAIPHPKDPRRRDGRPRIFSGPIASANILLKNPVLRDLLRDQYGIKAVEMEGSGIADAGFLGQFGYFVIRGIVDYCDIHKDKIWRQYSAEAAAAYARALLEATPPF